MSKSYIEVEAFVSSEQEIYCKDCARRKGIKNGKERFLYEIGDAPCKACGIMDILDDVEAYSEAFPADVKPVVRGEWVIEETVEIGGIWVKWCCDECGYVRTQGWKHTKDGEKPKAKYCENCGADMREEVKDEP